MSKKKFIITVIVIFLILIVIYFAIVLLFGRCGPRIAKGLRDVGFCDKSCEKDEDCKFECGCGAINKEEVCDLGNVTIDCEFIPSEYVKCKQNRCEVTLGK